MITLDIMIEAGDWGRLEDAEALAQKAAQAALAVTYEADGDFEASVMLTDDAQIQELNRTWRAKDKPTNVLSFPAAQLAPGSNGLPAKISAKQFSGLHELGDLAICAPVVAREAKEQGKPAQAHWAHMVVHGVLHLLGFDHENDRDAIAMEARETKILAQFGYDNPYA